MTYTPKSNNRLAGFLYEIMRDGCPTGIMEETVRKEEGMGPGMEVILSNEHLARYAEELADRLVGVWDAPPPKLGSGPACIGHCCAKHGCKYGYEDCVVASGQEDQEYECMKGAWCGEPGLFTDYNPHEHDEDDDDEES